MDNADVPQATSKVHKRIHLHPIASGDSIEDILRALPTTHGAENGTEEKVLSGIDEGQGTAV